MTAPASGDVPMVSAARMRTALPWSAAVDALDAAYRQPLPDAPARTVLPTPHDGELMLMPAVGTGSAGVKVLGLRAANRELGVPFIQGVFVLLDGTTLTPRLILDGAELTRLRTAALSALATRSLARPDASRLVVYGSGVQAEAHVGAVSAVRPITAVTVVDRDRAAGERLVEMLASNGVAARLHGPESVAEADVVCCCTTSPTPVFDGRLLPDGTHVNAVGAYTAQTRELDETTLVRAATIVVDDRAAVLAKGGDLVIPLNAGRLRADAPDGVLQDVVSGAIGRRSATDITIYKSVGVAYQDLMFAEAIAQRLA